MTASGDFIPGDAQDFEGAPTYPTVFGVQLTPVISGLLLFVLGVAGAMWLYFNLVQGEAQSNQQLKTDIASKEALLVDQDAIEQQIAEAETRKAEADQMRSDVLALFATDDSISTLLLDVNARVQSVNAGIQDEDDRANLSRFELDPELSGVITDGSFGAEVNNRLQRNVFNVAIEGNFPQTEAIIRSIERLQPLIVLRDYQSSLEFSDQSILINPQGQVTANNTATGIVTEFQLNVLSPAPEGTYEAATAPAPEEEAAE